LRVLLVEDDASSAEAMRDLLEMSGHAVDCAGNGREALEMLRDASPYCVILLDVMMPVMNGYEFRDEQLKDPRLASIPVIVLTADGRTREKARRLRTNQFFQKPFSPPDLLRAVEGHCPVSLSDDEPGRAVGTGGRLSG
jgi:CheY-like chemotaxis protein